MVNDRPYKNIMTKRDALLEISEKAGSQFDPAIAQLFVKLMEKEEQIV